MSRVRTVLDNGVRLAVFILLHHALASAEEARQLTQPRQEFLSAIPLAFEPNVGQVDLPASFLARGPGFTVFLDPSGATLRTSPVTGDGHHQDEIRFEFVGGDKAVLIAGLVSLPGTANYFLGNNPARWRTNLTTYSRIRYKDIYPGILADFYGAPAGFEFDLLIEPGARPEEIRLRIEGADDLALSPDGDLLIASPHASLQMRAPVAYQRVGDTTVPVSARFQLDEPRTVRFLLGSYDASRILVLDPVIAYSSYFGGSALEAGNALAADNQGNLLLGGTTESLNYPTVSALQPSPGSTGPLRGDAFLTKISADGSTVLFSTYFGGNHRDRILGMAVDSVGAVYITGETLSSNLPTTSNAAQPGFGGGFSDAFVAKLDATGSSIEYSSYLGGGGQDLALGLAVDSTGAAYVVGETRSADFPTVGAVQPSLGIGACGTTGLPACADGFVTKINPAGTAVLFSTYLGGGSADVTHSAAVDSGGNVYVTGQTESSDFPVHNAFQATYSGGSGFFRGDAFVAELDTNGTSFVYSTYLGALGWDRGLAIAVDSLGSAYVTGETISPAFPLVNPFQATTGPVVTAFVTKFQPGGAALDYSTFLGGGGDRGFGIAVDPSGRALVAGSTSSTSFPTHQPLQPALAGGSDAFLTIFAPAGSSVDFSTYFGGTGDEAATVAIDALGNAYLAGSTTSLDLPLVVPIQPSNAGGQDAFATKLSFTLPVEIDIKPGSFPNCFNLNGHGVIPVAVLGAPDFDVTAIDPNSLLLDGLAVRVRGNRGPQCSFQNSNGDASLDLVCQFEDDADDWVGGGDFAVLNGHLFDGRRIRGTDSICIVPGA